MAPITIVSLLLQVGFAVHAARTGRMQPWLWIILFIPGLGWLIYVIVELLPELLRGRAARQAKSGIVARLDPGRQYRSLARACEIAPTVYNRMRLAEECLRLGRTDEAVALYEQCAVGMHADDPAVRMGLAQARFQAGDYPGTIAELDRLRQASPERRTADGHLLYARALDGAGRTQEALAEYAALVAYYPGEEARARYAELLARQGHTAQSQTEYAEILRRVELQGGTYRRAQSAWYAAARRAAAPAP